MFPSLASFASFGSGEATSGGVEAGRYGPITEGRAAASASQLRISEGAWEKQFGRSPWSRVYVLRGALGERRSAAGAKIYETLAILQKTSKNKHIKTRQTKKTTHTHTEVNRQLLQRLTSQPETFDAVTSKPGIKYARARFGFES